MRLTYMYYLIKKNYEDLRNLKLTIESERIAGANLPYGLVYNWLMAKRALQKIANIPVFQDFANDILNNEYFQHDSDNFRIPTGLCRNLIPEYTAFLERLQGALQFYEATSNKAVNIGFDIKLPPTKDFSKLSKDIELINRILSQCPYLKADGETIEVESVDIGSIWFKFAVGAVSTSIILSNLASVVDKCVKIKSHMITCKQQEEQYRTLNLENTILENLIDANKTATDALIKRASEELQQNLGKLPPEDAERLNMTLKDLSELMSKGLEIYASIDTPDEIKDLFPTSDEIKSLNEPMKLLTEEIMEE